MSESIKPRLRFWQIWNMSFGFLGIQFGWALQMANMSAVYEKLGATADQLPQEQRTRGFAMQALFIGLGAVAASSMPYFLGSVRAAFYIGAGAFLGAVLWTIATTQEYPPEDLDALRKTRVGIRGGAAEIMHDLRAMPRPMRRLAWVQIFTWLGLFCMWLYFGVAVAHDIFHATPGSPEYDDAIAWGGNCFAVYSAVCFAFSFVLPSIANKLGRKLTHASCLVAGALGLISVALIHDKYMLFVSMTAVGIAWASILSMPYAILAGCLPPGKTGVYMGIFNFFIVIPEILAALVFGWVMDHLLGGNRMAAVVVGGVAMATAAVLVSLVHDERR